MAFRATLLHLCMCVALSAVPMLLGSERMGSRRSDEVGRMIDLMLGRPRNVSSGDRIVRHTTAIDRRTSKDLEILFTPAEGWSLLPDPSK